MILLRRLQGYWLMIHPFPVMMVVTLATVLAVATARESTDWARLVRAMATLFFSQVVVGISNDYHDRALDAQAQPWKPLAHGVVTLGEARALIVAAFMLMLALAVSLGPMIVLLALLGTFAGILYNFWLRGTPFSWFPYVLGFVTLPIFVWVSMERFDARQLVLVPIGLPLLVGVHLAQTLPDTETDRALGVRGFAVTLGRARGALAMWSALIGAQMLALVSALALDSNLEIVLLATSASFALVAASIALYHRAPSSATLRVVFHLVAPSAVILVAGWLAALQSREVSGMFRRPFRGGRANLVLMQAIRQVNQMIANGQAKEAAQMLMRLVQESENRGRPRLTANLHAQAARAYAVAKDEQNALSHARSALDRFVQLNMLPRVPRFYANITRELRANGMNTSADALQQEFGAKAKELEAKGFAAPAQHGRLPAKCPPVRRAGEKR